MFKYPYNIRLKRKSGKYISNWWEMVFSGLKIYRLTNVLYMLIYTHAMVKKHRSDVWGSWGVLYSPSQETLCSRMLPSIPRQCCSKNLELDTLFAQGEGGALQPPPSPPYFKSTPRSSLKLPWSFLLSRWLICARICLIAYLGEMRRNHLGGDQAKY